MLEKENQRTALLFLVVVAVFGAVIFGYYRYYRNFPALHEETASAADPADSQNPWPIRPFLAFSSLKDPLQSQLGVPDTAGEGVSEDTKYFIYESKPWFEMDARTTFYYGKENRVYRSVLRFKKGSAEQVAQNLEKIYGKPLQDNPSAEKTARRRIWLQDSVQITLSEKEYPYLDLRLAYYPNPDQLPLGNRPTVITRQEAQLDGEPGKESILLVGSKANYTDAQYRNLFVVVGSGKGSFFAPFPTKADGGEDPRLILQDLDGDGRMEIIVSANQAYINSYNAFRYQKGQLIHFYHGEKEPRPTGPLPVQEKLVSPEQPATSEDMNRVEPAKTPSNKEKSAQPQGGTPAEKEEGQG